MNERKDDIPEEIAQNFFEYFTQKDFNHLMNNVLFFGDFPKSLIRSIILKIISGKLLGRGDSEMLKLFLGNERVRQHIGLGLHIMKENGIEKYDNQIKGLKTSIKERVLDCINEINFITWLNAKRINSRIMVIIKDVENPEDDRNDFYPYRGYACTTYIREDTKEIIVESGGEKNIYIIVDRIIHTNNKEGRNAFALINYDTDKQRLLSLEDGKFISFEEMCSIVHGKFSIQKIDGNGLKWYIITLEDGKKIRYITNGLKETIWKTEDSVFNYSDESLLWLF